MLKDWDRDFVDLTWTPPEDDGGAPIEKYIVQMRDKEGRQWIDAAKVSGDKTQAKVLDGIQEGHEYEFRIVAVNMAGPGEPSDSSKSVVAKPRFCKSSLSLFFLAASLLSGASQCFCTTPRKNTFRSSPSNYLFERSSNLFRIPKLSFRSILNSNILFLPFISYL